MKKVIYLMTLVLLATQSSYCQERISLNRHIEGKLNRNINLLQEGTSATFLGFISISGAGMAIFNINNRAEHIPVNMLNRFTFFPTDTEEFWMIKAIENNVYASLLSNGYQYTLRSEIEKDVLDYQVHLNNNNLIFEDSYLEDYISSLVHKILPRQINDGRPGELKIIIVKDPVPNAGIYSNGTMVINTGLLSAINSEEELMAVLAHEIAHFVLDHSVININTAIRRQKRAEFWATVVTGIAVVTETYVAANNPDYYPGDLTWYSSVLAHTIAEQVNERMGLKYSRNQEIAADKVAKEFLEYIGRDPLAISSVLLKLDNFNLITQNFLALRGGDFHPSSNERVSLIGEPGEFFCQQYDRRISLVNSYNARQLFNAKKLDAARDLAKRNIDAGVATEDDYMIMAGVNMALYFDEGKNYEALEYIRKALTVNIYPPMNIYKQEALIYLRLNRNTDALESLNKYIQTLGNIMNSGSDQFLEGEYEWTIKMIAKTQML